MKKILIFIMSLSVLFFSACSKDKQEITDIRAKGFDENAQVLFVEFNKNIAIEGLGVKKEREIFINNKSTKVKYQFENPKRMLIFLDLEPKQVYKIKVDLSDILSDAKELEFDIQTSASKMAVDGYFTHKFEDKSVLVLNVRSSFALNKEKLGKALSILIENKKIDIDRIVIQDDIASVYSKMIDIGQKNTDIRVRLDSSILGLNQDLNYFFILPSKKEFVFQSANIINRSVELKFSKNISLEQNVKELISINPSIEFKTTVFADKINIHANFSPNQIYTIKIAKGLKSDKVLSTQRDYEAKVDFKDYEPAISFSSDGVFLSSKASKKIAFKTLNVKKVHLELWQVFPNNLSEYLRYKNLQGSKNTSSFDSDIFSDADFTSEMVMKREFNIENTKNEWMQHAIILDGLKDLNGVFIVNLYFKEEDIDYIFDDDFPEFKKYRFFEQKAKVSKNLIFSDLALIAQKLDKKIFVDVRDFTTQKAIQNAKIDLISKTNQILDSKMSDSDGLVVFDNVDENKILYISAAKDRQVSILRLSSPLLTDGFDVDGVELNSNNKAFIYTERGVYRPGDDIHLSIVTRNDKGAIKHPIFLSLFDVRNKKLLDKIKLDPISDGTFYKKISLAKNAPSGIYLARVEFGGEVFDKEILVQNIIPNRIKVDLQSPKIIQENDKIDFNISSNYLFGAPSSNLKFQANLYVNKKEFKNTKYPDYIFSNPSVLEQKYSDTLEGSLDEEGKVSQKFTLNALKPSYNLEAILSARVFEKGGRDVESVSKTQIHLYDSFVGIKKLNNNYFSSGAELNFDVIVSDLNETLIPNRTLKYIIYSNDYSWWWDYDNYNEFLQSLKKDKNTQIIASGELRSKDKPARISFDTKNYTGEMFIELIDTYNNTSTGEFFYVGGFGAPSNASIVDTLKIKSDKKEYHVGESAVVEFESIKGAKAIVTLNDNTKILKRFVVDTHDETTSVYINMEKNYKPNVYVSVILLQNYNDYTNDRALRLFGVLPLKIMDENTKLDLDLKVPQKLMPDEEFEVEIQSKNKQAYTYTLAIVDEGLLDLSAFKTPDIWGYFFQKIRFNMAVYDSYDKIIARVSGKLAKIFNTGGDDYISSRANKSKNDEQATRFKPVVLFQSPIRSDENGYAKLKFKMPSYLGSVKVMVVASNENSFGSISKNIQVSAPAIMLETLPRVLRMGDEFKILMEVFKIDDDLNTAKLSLKAKNSLISFNKNEFLIDFKNEKVKNIYIDSNVSANDMGIEELEFSLEAKNYVYKQNVQIDIKALNAISYDSKSFILPAKSSMSFDLNESFINPKAFLSVSAKPILNLNHRLKYLQNYPYGCIEQSTSAVLPQLFLQKLDLKKLEQKHINNINSLIAKYSNFQTANGGFSYWQGLRESDDWASNYAGMFLILAKEQGYYVNEGMYKAWLDYEKRYILDSKADINIKINSLYLLALAKQANLSVMNSIYENKDYMQRLSNVSLWQLGAAYKLAGFDEVALQIASTLSTKPDEKMSYVHTYGSLLRDEAIIANAYKIIYGKNNQELLHSIKQSLEGDSWFSTQSIGYALYALANSFEENSSKNMNAKLKLNNQDIVLNQDKIQNFEFSEGKAFIETQDELFVNFGIEGIKRELEPAFSNKINIQREFYDEDGKELDESSLSSSKIFYMRLRVSLNDNVSGVSNLALTQILPSGWEVVSNILSDEMPSFVNNSSYDFIDIRDDKIMWFFTLYHEREKSFFVKLNAVTPGVYTLSGAYVEAMYDNSYKALGESKKVKVMQ